MFACTNGTSTQTKYAMPITLPPLQLVEISGAEAIAFAQAQFSSDVGTLEVGNWQWSAWLTAQGRVRAFFHLLRIREDTLWLVLRGGDAQRLRDALVRYVLRAKVILRVVEGMQAFAVHADAADTPQAAAAGGIMLSGDGRVCLSLPGTLSRWLLLAPAAHLLTADDSDQARNAAVLADIDTGLVTLDPVLAEQLLPQWLGLDVLGAISVRKGCYPGQEVVARLHFKGGVKRALYRIDFCAAALPFAGTAILSGAGDESGVIVNAAWREPELATALAVVHDAAPALDTLLVDSNRIDALARAIPDSA
jgi:folate-binding protein YgfZ